MCRELSSVDLNTVSPTMTKHRAILAEMQEIYSRGYKLLQDLSELVNVTVDVQMMRGQRGFPAMPHHSRVSGVTDHTRSYLRYVVALVADELSGSRELELPDVETFNAEEMRRFTWETIATEPAADLEAFAARLHQKYGAIVELLSHQQAADTFVRVFGISTRKPPTIRQPSRPLTVCIHFGHSEKAPWANRV